MKNNEFRLLDYLDPICEGHYIKDMTFPVIITTFIWLLLAVYWKGDCCSFSSTKSTIKNRLLIVNETDCGFSFVFRKFNKRKKSFFYFLLIEVLSFCVLWKWRTLCWRTSNWFRNWILIGIFVKIVARGLNPSHQAFNFRKSFPKNDFFCWEMAQM